MEVGVLIGGMFLLIAIGVPIGFAVGAACVLTMVLFPDISMLLIAQNCFTALNSFPLLAIPFFVLSGSLMSSGGIARRLLDAANAIFGFLTGGLAMVATASCVFFGAVSGSGVATTSAIGGFMIPEMKDHGYDDGFSAALVAASGTIGVIIPPSIPFVMYAVATGTSLSDMFLAGLIPGIMMGLALMVVSYIISKKRHYGVKTKFIGFRALLRTLWDAKWALLTPVIILGGIYAGLFTPTEAAVVAVIYSYIVGRFIYKELDVKTLFKTLGEAGVVSAVTTFMLTFSTTFSTFITMKQIPQLLSELMISMTSNKVLLLLTMNAFLLIVGCLIDILPATLILAPILLPVAVSLGLGPVHFGIIMTVNLAIGFITPPYGINLFTACAVGGLPMNKIVKNIVWFLLALIIVLMFITFCPPIVEFLL